MPISEENSQGNMLMQYIQSCMRVILRVIKWPHPMLHPALSHRIEMPKNERQSEQLLTSED